ncbi:MAG: type VI secretion system contractile sheath large subunit, partial [bacterium]|nr:type VI secretion system contractile sheath large subunit [bacterium]
LEASWRSLDWLVRTIEDGAHTRIFLLDINRPALATALEESSDLNKSHLYRVLNDYFENEILIIGDYRFGSEPEDIRLLSRLGLLARELNGSFIAEADSNFFENDGVEAENSWRTLRESAAASHLGLAFPRVLLRLPYGERSDPIESFAFEEIAGRPTGNAYLWGNPAFACAILSVINRIRAKPESLTVIGEMPAYSYREDGESRLQPCTEQLLSESEADKILSQGVMPVLGSKNRNSIQIPWLHTLVLQQVSIDGLSEP